MSASAVNGHRRKQDGVLQPDVLQPVVETMAITAKTKVWLEAGGRFVIGDGGVRLLDGIARQGSLLAAAREMGWSYRHAWGYLRRAHAALGAPLAIARPGKGAARGMALTETGRRLLTDLQLLRARIDTAVGPTGPTPAEIAARGRSSRLRRRRRA